MKLFYLIFAIAVALDLILFPPLANAGWLPRFTLSILPFLFLASSRRDLTVFSGGTVLFFWILGGLNLGIALFSIGLAIFFERWFLPKIFQRDSWQMFISSAGAVAVFGTSAASLSEIFTPEASLFGVSFVLTIITSTALAIGINFFLKHLYAGTV